MLLRLCQLKSLHFFLIALFLSACSWRKVEIVAEPEPEVSNQWFSTNQNHSLVDAGGVPVSHLLFDATPELDPTEQTVNVVIATPEGSPYGLEIDMNSGQRYYSHSYCKQTDVWGSYKGSLNLPNFSIGYIPRMLDQLGEAQKVIVWSRRREFRDSALVGPQSVRLVGAYVEQICPEGNCLGKDNWLSKLVFVGLDAKDSSLATVKEVKDFTNTFDWKTSKALLENINGRNFIGEQASPAVRVGQLISFEESFDYFKKRSIHLSDVELKKIQRGCHLLYDRLWEEVGKVRPEDEPAKTIEELNAKIKLKESLKTKKLPAGFAARFQSFTKKYFNEVSTCEKFVYHGNLNRDPEVFWFLSYMGLYYRLHREGFFFDCGSRSWQRNILDDRGRPVHDLKKEIDECGEQEIDQAMNYLPNFLKGLKSDKIFYRFIDYDNRSFGTHSKMYTWIKEKQNKFECRNDPNTEILKKMSLFPEDIEWKERNIKDISNEVKIIF
jgi:hypothetical protein